MADLHSRIASELSRRLEVAKAAAEGGASWRLERGPFVAVEHHHLYSVNEDGRTITVHGHTRALSQPRVDHIQLHDPADAILRYELALRVLDLHRPVLLRGGPGGKYYETATVCRSCSPPQFAEEAWPCATLLLVAASLGLDTEGSTTDG